MRLTAADLCDGNSAQQQVRVRSCRLSQSRGGQAIFRFEGSDSISEAEKLVGLEVQIPLTDRMNLPSGSYYVTDLMGCEVKDQDGLVLGVVTGVQFTGEDVPGTPILIVDSSQGELLIPLAREICIEIDPAARSIRVTPPEGLLDLNRNS
jgi:16S rRNA processing protein RimM